MNAATPIFDIFGIINNAISYLKCFSIWDWVICIGIGSATLCIGKIRHTKNVACITFLLMYAFVMLSITVFTRECQLCREYSFEILWTAKTIILEHNFDLFWEAFYNVFLFMPFSYLCFLTIKGSKKKRFKHSIIITISFSLLIELLQLMLRRGLCEIDDVIYNTVGGILGIAAAYMSIAFIDTRRRN